MRRLLGWSAQETVWGIRAGSLPLGNLRTGEFVLFISHISTGLGLSITSFLLLLEDFGLQLQHLTPHSILLTAIFMHLRHPLSPLLCPGEVREGQRRSGGVLFPNEERPAVAVHLRAHWRKVGGVAQGVGHRHHRSQ